MFASLSNKGKAILFIILAYSLGVIFSLLPNMNTFFYMFIPMLTTLIMMFVFTRDGYSKEGWKSLGLHKLGFKMWPFAIIVPLLPLVIGYGFVWMTGLGDFSVAKDFQGFSWSAFPLVIVFLLIKTTLMESLGEELGWRGYLLPKLLPLGMKKALLLSGLIHCLWHFPIILFTDLYHADETLSIMLPLFILTFVFIGPVFGYLRIKTGSVWPASLIHTSHNLYWGVFAYLTQSNSEVTKYLVGDTGVFLIVFYALMTLWVFKKLRSEKDVIPTQKDVVA
ncbi:type II CAAX prenyl endopeptidase Rce1 family protein [Fredinandcohnia humi]